MEDAPNPIILSIIFKKLPRNELKMRHEFIKQLCIINEWSYLDDGDVCINDIRIDFEKLFQNYIKTDCIPYFDNLVISFVKYVDSYLKTRSKCERLIYIVYIDLLINYGSYKPMNTLMCCC